MTLQPNEEMIRDYLELIYGEYGDLSAIMAIRCLKDDKSTEQRFPLLEIDAAVEWIAGHNKAGWNPYVTHARAKTRIKGKFVSDDDMAESAWLVADADDPDALENIKTYSPPPQIMVITGEGRGWGLWPADNNATNKNTHKKRHEQLAKELRTDPAVTNFSRIIPIAGTVRYQPESKRAKGYKDGLITFEFTPHPPLDTGRLANPTAKVLYLNQGSGMTISDAHEKLREIKDGNRHEPMLQGAIALRENGLRDDQILEALEPHANPNNPQEPRDIQKWVSQNIQPNRPPSNEAQPEKPLPEFDLQRFGGSLVEPAICYSLSTQVSPEMAFMATLGAAAIATQHLGDVEHFSRSVKPRPLNLFVLIIGESGERKTKLFNEVTDVISKFESQRIVDYNAQLREHDLQMQIFQQREKDLIKKHKNTEARADLLAEQPPEPPEGKRIIFGADSSPQALQKFLPYNQPCIAKVESEGAIYSKGYAKERSVKDGTHAFENAAWDGVCPASERVMRESTPKKDMRLTMLVGVQPDPIQEMLNDPITKNMGTLARWLISWPPSTIGTRLHTDEEKPTHGIDQFNERILRCLQIEPRMSDGGLTLVGRQQMPNKLDLPVLLLSPKARERFIEFYNNTERRLLTDLSGHSDVGSKAAEQALRIAGVMTFYENPYAKEVPENIAASAIALTDYLVSQNIKLTGGGISRRQMAELKDHVAERWGDEPFYLAQAQQFWKGSRRKSDVLMDLSKLVDNGYLEQLPPTEIDGTLRQSVWKVLP